MKFYIQCYFVDILSFGLERYLQISNIFQDQRIRVCKIVQNQLFSSVKAVTSAVLVNVCDGWNFYEAYTKQSCLPVFQCCPLLEICLMACQKPPISSL